MNVEHGSYSVTLKYAIESNFYIKKAILQIDKKHDTLTFICELWPHEHVKVLAF